MRADDDEDLSGFNTFMLRPPRPAGWYPLSGAPSRCPFSAPAPGVPWRHEPQIPIPLAGCRLPSVPPTLEVEDDGFNPFPCSSSSFGLDGCGALLSFAFPPASPSISGRRPVSPGFLVSERPSSPREGDGEEAGRACTVPSLVPTSTSAPLVAGLSAVRRTGTCCALDSPRTNGAALAFSLGFSGTGTALVV